MHPILFKTRPADRPHLRLHDGRGRRDWPCGSSTSRPRKRAWMRPLLLDAAFYTIIVSLIGAKLILFLGQRFATTSSSPKELFSLARSGGVFQGGLTFGVIFALWYFHKKKIPTWTAADIIAPALALGHGFGRIGCFSAGCCYGSECAAPWGVVFKNAYAHELTGIPLNVAPPSRPALRGGPQFPQLRRPLLHPEEEKVRRPGLLLLYHQLLRSSASSPSISGATTPTRSYFIHGATPFLEPVLSPALLHPGRPGRGRAGRGPEPAPTCLRRNSSSRPTRARGDAWTSSSPTGSTG